MSGRYQGMQARICSLNKFATFVPCFGHSLNLVGVEAAKACTEAVAFFDLLQAVYVFFTASTGRFKKLMDKLAESDTRWSCRADECRAFVNGYEEIMETLLEMSDDPLEKADCRCTARGLYGKMSKLETGIFGKFWNVVLQRFNSSSKTLQAVQLNLNAVVGILKSLVNFVQLQRDKFEEFEEAGKRMAGTNAYE